MPAIRESCKKKSAVVTPSDTVNVPDAPCQGLWVGTGGNVTLVLHGDDGASPRVLKNVPSGTYLDLAIKKIMTATTALDLVAFY
jgi:hypothetical protein